MTLFSKKISCELCGSDKHAFVYKKSLAKLAPPAQIKEAELTGGYKISESELQKPRRIARCVSCGLTFAIPDLTSETLTRNYEEMEDPDYVSEERGRRMQAGIVLDRIEKQCRSGRLLDVGCGPGFLLDEAKKRGWQVQGADLSRWGAQTAKERFGIDVFQGTLKDAAFPDKHFDAISLLDVIEHVPDPRAVLKEVFRILKNDGVVYISTPDINSPLSRILGGRWWGINKYHLFYFSRRTIKELFRKTGFRAVKFASYPRIFSLRYWAKRLKDYPKYIHVPFSWLAAPRFMGNQMLSVTFHDQIDVVARKARTLETIRELEGGAQGEAASSGTRQKRVVAVLPAYNAETTLERTVEDIPKNLVDEIVLVDDKSRDGTVALARKLGLTVVCHDKNRGYGGNQKTCYDTALEHGADVVVMVHPDYQYDPTAIPDMVEPIRRGEADAVFGSRMMKGGALEGGMPIWKHNANILLTAFENVILGTYLTEYHSGFRAYSADLLRAVRYQQNSDNFVFDTEIIVQILANRFKIEEVPIRTRYFEEASSIAFWPSIVYGLGILRTMFFYGLHRNRLLSLSRFKPKSE